MLIRLHHDDKGYALERVDPAKLHYEPGHRRVLLFPGEGVSDHSSPGALIGSIKYVDQTLMSAKATGEPIDVFLCTYELPNEDFGGRYDHYKMNRNAISYYGRQATNYAVLPMLLKEKEKLSELTPELLKERLSSLTLFGHSYGSIAIQDMANALMFDLRRIGWKDEVIADTMKELVEISVAPIARGDFPAPNLTKFYFTAVNDMTAIDRIRIENPSRERYLPLLKASGYTTMANAIAAHDRPVAREQLLDDVKAKVTATRKPGYMPKASVDRLPCGYVLSAMLPDDEIRWIEKNSEGMMVCRHLTAEDAKDHGMTVTHDYRTYLHGDHTLGQVLINTANNAVLRETGIGDGHQLMMNTALTRDQLHTRSAANARAKVSERGVLSGEWERDPSNSARSL